MKIHEFQAKQVLRRFGVPAPDGAVCETPEEARDHAAALGAPVVIKAQVLVGGRGKAGGVKVARTPEEAFSAAGAILGMDIKGLTVHRVLVEPALDIREEYYIGVALDRASQRNTVIVSAAGGVDIEEVAEQTPGKIARHCVDPVIGFRSWHALDVAKRGGIPAEALPGAVDLLQKLMRAYLESDAVLAEVNPLALTADGELVAADAKMVIDDNALFRQEELASLREDEGEDPIEAEARRRAVQYVRLDGDIGIIGNGAGLVMATIDEVRTAGGKAANFLDIGGGARAELVRNALEIVLMDPRVRCVFFNVFGGITRGDEVARGILAARESLEVRVPMVIRLAGTEAEAGRRLLDGSGLIPAETMQEAAAKAVELARA